ncbi:excisionase family DNA-binding protein [Massilia yuzhufengensis]|uniref:DNA binding domain-containing protein, excisionase family n=1 Tax=Massilia yuzhufengensis TaxID=1164594 RepID=A0A1I1TDD3_9BURK|nr:excisionase family DNA-binding protein [Massilia yuzhufengensis]SFD55138.1 DNA binding domain-containing protein, excisionase family [Massilia yuzhufengensis]
MPTLKEPVDVMTTQEAASYLGVSVSSVQKLVESGVLSAWRTQGGHRRIPREALLAYKGGLEPAGAQRAARSRLIVVEDDPMLRAVYAARIAQWELPLDLTICRSGYDGLIEIGVNAPDILLLDISMRGIDGYEIMETVLARPALRHVHIAIVTGLEREELDSRGGIPPGVAFFQKPLPLEQLRGFVTACCMHKQRAQA